MLRIAICDDNQVELQYTARLTADYFAAHPAHSATIETFHSGKDLLSQAEARKGFDLYILDILMPDLSGIEIGRRLRTLGAGGEIIYLTSSNDFAADSYEVRAFFYLLKPVEQQKLYGVLDEATEKLNREQNAAIMVNTPQGTRRILMERIRYAERVGRCIRYHCTDGTLDSLTIRSSFKEMMEPLLADRHFRLCGASYVLNFQYITGINGQTCLLDNGQTIVLPKAAAAAFKQDWGRYWLEEVFPK